MPGTPGISPRTSIDVYRAPSPQAPQSSKIEERPSGSGGTASPIRKRSSSPTGTGRVSLPDDLGPPVQLVRPEYSAMTSRAYPEATRANWADFSDDFEEDAPTSRAGQNFTPLEAYKESARAGVSDDWQNFLRDASSGVATERNVAPNSPPSTKSGKGRKRALLKHVASSVGESLNPFSKGKEPAKSGQAEFGADDAGTVTNWSVHSKAKSLLRKENPDESGQAARAVDDSGRGDAPSLRKIKSGLSKVTEAVKKPFTEKPKELGRDLDKELDKKVKSSLNDLSELGLDFKEMGNVAWGAVAEKLRAELNKMGTKLNDQKEVILLDAEPYPEAKAKISLLPRTEHESIYSDLVADIASSPLDKWDFDPVQAPDLIKKKMNYVQNDGRSGFPAYEVAYVKHLELMKLAVNESKLQPGETALREELDKAEKAVELMRGEEVQWFAEMHFQLRESLRHNTKVTTDALVEIKNQMSNRARAFQTALASGKFEPDAAMTAEGEKLRQLINSCYTSARVPLDAVEKMKRALADSLPPVEPAEVPV